MCDLVEALARPSPPGFDPMISWLKASVTTGAD